MIASSIFSALFYKRTTKITKFTLTTMTSRESYNPNVIRSLLIIVNFASLAPTIIILHENAYLLTEFKNQEVISDKFIA